MKKLIFLWAGLLLVVPCQAETICTEDIPGDVDENCKVDFNDFAIMASDWLEVSDFESNIAQEWVRRYGGVSTDEAHAIATDSSGNIYVTGESTTIKYDANGNELWVRTYSGTDAKAIAVDSSGNVYVTGMDGSSWGDYITIKYDPNGNSLWVATYGVYGETDAARAIAIDSANNIYVTGIIGSFPGDYATVKYNSDGDELWEATYNGPGNSMDQANAITIDSSDNIYVTGWSWGSDTGYDYATIKYTPDGNELWVWRYVGGGHKSAYAIAMDSAENILVTGGGSGYATIKYDPNGNELWVANYNGPGNDDDRAYAIMIDSNDNIYVTGESWGLGTESDYATIKYDPNGNELWVARYNGPGNDVDWAKAIAKDSNDNIYVTGHSWGLGTSGDYATIKYDSNGHELWVERYNGLANAYDGANALAIDNANNIYVTGESMGAGTDDDYATIKYSLTYHCIALPDSWEPDDTYSQANWLGTKQTHNIAPAGDVDWLKFLLVRESEVVIETSGKPGGNTRMWLYDSGLNQIEYNNDGGAGSFSRIDRLCGLDPLPAGTYYVAIDKYGNDDEIPSYDITLTVTTCVAPRLDEPLPIFRFWSPIKSRHFYTIGEPERNKLFDIYPDVWAFFEGIVYYAFAKDAEPNLMPVYRFWSPVLEAHFYTISESERDKLINIYPHVWTYEGTAFYAYPEGQQPQEAKPVYRFWSDSLETHFYTISETEKNKLIDNYPHIWTYERIAWYAYE